MKRWLKGFLALAVVLIGVSAIGVQASASKQHYQATPKSIRGTWYMIQNKRLRFRVTIKKYSVETESTKPSYFISDRTLLRSNEELPSLYISKKRTKHGYWLVGLRNGTQYGLKRGAKDARGYVTLKEHYYGKPKFTQTLYSRSSLKPYVQALNEKQAWSFDDFMVDFNG